MRERKPYDKEKDWKERTSTAVVSIVIMAVSLVVFILGACMLFTWLANKDADAKMQSEETQVIQAVQEHYQILPTSTSKCVKVRQDTNTGKRYYIVVINERTFKADYHTEDGINIVNVEEIQV